MKNSRIPGVCCSILLCLTILSFPASALSAPGTTINVNTGEDQYGTDPAHCSLREAVQAANTDTAFGGCPAGSGNDTILLVSGSPHFLLTIPGYYGDDNSCGDLNISSDMTIQGYGWQATLIDAGCNPTPSRVFHIYNPTQAISVTISELSIFYGDSRNENGGTIYNREDLTLDGVGIQDGHSNLNGGAIYSSPQEYSQALTIQNSTFYGNSCVYGGGAIASFGEMLIEDSYFSGNDADLASLNSNSDGGALYSGSTPLTIRRTHFSSNSAGGDGGNLFIESSGGFILIEDSILTGGIAGIGSGGNLMAYKGNPDYYVDVTIRRSEISDGQANHAFGGGIYNNVALTLENVTISGNQAQVGGGGIYTTATGSYADSAFKNITLTDNLDTIPGMGGDGLFVATSNPVSISNSILAMNGPDAVLGYLCDCQQSISLSAGNNLESGATCGFTAGGDLQYANPMLSPLASRGFGVPRTHALQLASPALDAGSNATCLTNDQRGYWRPADGDGDGVPICDMGAFEWQWERFMPLLMQFP